jgi:hypothetical protein
VKTIVLPKYPEDYIALVSDEDYERVSKLHWGKSSRKYAYPTATVNGQSCTMHVFIMGKAPKGFVWDHIDGNRLNNQRDNLRLVTRSENRKNAHTANNGRKYKPSRNISRRVVIDVNSLIAEYTLDELLRINL